MVSGPLTGAPLGFPAADVDPVFVSASQALANPVTPATRTVAGIVPVDGTITQIWHVCKVDATGGAGDLRVVITDSAGNLKFIETLQTAPIVEDQSFVATVSLPVLAGEMVYEILQGVGIAGEATVTVRVEPTL